MSLTRCRPLLGTFVEITAERSDLIEAGFEAIGRVHRLMSAHDPESDVGRLNAAPAGVENAITLDPSTIRVIGRAACWAEWSEGCFDIVAAARSAIGRGAIPRHSGQGHFDPAADYRSLHVRQHRAWFDRPAAIDLGGIAKGHAVDEAIRAIHAAGARWALVNAGGDLAAFGRPQRVTIVDPATRAPRVEVTVDDEALATSGGVPTAGGIDFAHLPRRGIEAVSVTVKAARAIDADALTKLAWAGHPRIGQLLALAEASGFALTAHGTALPLDAPAMAE